MKRQGFRFSRAFGVIGVMGVIALLVSSCLNPIDFNPEEFTLNVNVTGSITTKIEDVAVVWLINRTKNVNVVNYTITRDQAGNETDAQYVYPKNYGAVPASTAVYASASASYHNPTELPYTITVVTDDPEYLIFGPFTAQFPRAQDYKYYLYWTTDGKLVLVDEDKMKELPPDPEDNYPDPQPSSVNAQTLVVLNVTPDQNLDAVEFVKNPYIYTLVNEPRAKDQEMILLGSGSYDATAYYTRGGTQHTVGKTAIVTKEDGSMAVRTNFLYFYKTDKGGYDLSQYWPPLAKDADVSNKPEDALLDNQGILEIRNNAVANNPHALVARININGTEYPDSANTTSYFAPGDPPLRYILPVGPVSVMFMPVYSTNYGQVSRRTIQSKTTTVLSYINDLGDPFAFPPDEGHGSGLIRITNNSTAVVTGAIVYNKGDVANSLAIGYGEFIPEQPINYGKVGLVPVVGTAAVNLKSSDTQLIQVKLETTEGTIVLERLAALNNAIVDIVIAQSDLSPGGTDTGGRYGSKVTVKNTTTTPTKILGMYVYNVANEASMAIYPLDLSSPSPTQTSLEVLSTIGLPIVEGAVYRAKLAVHGNGLTGLITKDFSPDNVLYSTTPASHERSITLTQQDLIEQAPELIETFVPVTSVTFDSNPYTMTVYTESNADGSSKTIITDGALNAVNLKNLVKQVQPLDATTKSPIVWGSVTGAGASYVSFNSNTAVLSVTGIANDGTTLNVGFSIPNAAGTVTSRTDFTGTLQITLNYSNVRIRDSKVTGFTISPGASVDVDETLNLGTLVALNPSTPYAGGSEITAADLTWDIKSGSSNATLSGPVLTGKAEGTVTVRATMPGSKTASGSAIIESQTITVNPANGGHVNITGSAADPGTLYVTFSTKNNVVYGVKTKIVYLGGELNPYNTLGLTPSNATKTTPALWSIVSGFGAWEKVSLRSISNGPYLNAGGNTIIVKRSISDGLTLDGSTPWPLLGSVPIPVNGEQVKVRATIAGANKVAGQYVDFVSGEYVVTLKEGHYANSIVDLTSDFDVTTGSTITKGDTIDLKTLTYLASGTYASSDILYPISKDDLTWTITGGTGSATLTGSELSGTTTGTVTVQATLPAAKNTGVAITRTATITIQEPPPVNPLTFTLRIIKVPHIGDAVEQVVLVPTNAVYSETVSQTGYTGTKWADYTSGHHGTSTSHFADVSLMKSAWGAKAIWYNVLNAGTGNISSDGIEKDNEWVDITVPWPTDGATGYYMFFVEEDDRVRGYCLPGYKGDLEAEGSVDKNFLFYINPSYLYANRLLPMGTTKSTGHLQVNPATTLYLNVIPVSYTDWENIPSIMTSRGAGYRPRINYTSPLTLSKITHTEE